MCLGLLPCEQGSGCVLLGDALLFSTQHGILDPLPRLSEQGNSQLKPWSQMQSAARAHRLPDIWQICQEVNDNTSLNSLRILRAGEKLNFKGGLHFVLHHLNASMGCGTEPIAGQVSTGPRRSGQVE